MPNDPNKASTALDIQELEIAVDDGTTTLDAGLSAIWTRLGDGSTLAVPRGVAKGATVAASATVTTVDANHNGLDVAILGAIPLPAGAATEATLALVKAKTDNLDVALSTRAVSTTGPATATRTSATVTAVVSTILAANASRKGATLYHDGAGNCFVALGAGATITDFTVRLVGGDYYEVPAGYTGILTAIRSAGTNPLRVSELA